MADYICAICDYVYDEEAEGEAFAKLDDDWTCPECGTEKDVFERDD